MLMMLAGAHCKLGNPTAGLECLADAEAIIEKTNERREEPELAFSPRRAASAVRTCVT
jgi:hypothetical protein